MKLRLGFVSNSSSSSFIITNLTKKVKTLVDFVKENPQLIEEFVESYKCDYTQKDLLASAEENNIKLLPGDNTCVFGDESGTTIGNVFDYALRDGGGSESFSWRFHESLR